MSGSLNLPLPPWAPAALRNARLGVAQRIAGGVEESLQAFDWCSAVTGLMLAGASRSVASEVCDNPEALWILPRSRKTYWDHIRREGACHWDGMEPCCAGIAYHRGLAVIAYDRMKVIAQLQAAPIESSVPVPESHWRIQAIEAFDFLANTDMGLQNPFYI